MRRVDVVVALALSLAAPGRALPAPATVWQPMGKWAVDAAGDKCVLSREFASGHDRLSFTYRPWIAFSGVGITLVSPGLFATGEKVRVTLLPERRTFTLAGAPPNIGVMPGPGLTVGVQDGTFADAFARAQAIEVEGESAPVRIALEATGVAMAALRACANDRLRGYGLDPASVVAIPTEQMLAVLSSNNYPADAIRAGAQGRAVTVVGFDRAGTATSCRVATVTGNASLDQASCAAGLRLRLAPTADATETRWTVLPVNWVLPVG